MVNFQITHKRKIIAAAIYMVLWAATNLILGGFNDVVTWSCFGISVLASGFVTYQYLTVVEKVIRGELDPTTMIPMR